MTNIAGDDFLAQNGVDRSILAFEDAGFAGELPDRFIDTGGLDDTAVERNVAVQDGEAAFLGKGVGLVADAAMGAIEIKLVEATILRKRDLRRDAAGSGLEELVHLDVVLADHVPAINGFTNVLDVNGRNLTMNQAGTI